jgi:hypothetical protein
MVICVYIEGNKNGFISKNSIDKFKKNIKLKLPTDNINIEEFSQYIKYNYELKIIEKTNEYIRFNIEEKKVDIKISQNENEKKILHNKIKLLKSKRLNSSNIELKSDTSIVPSSIMKEYLKLLKMIPNQMLIPKPEEILSKPEEYKLTIPLFLNNSYVKKLPKNHPYIKYFKLIAKELNIPNDVMTPEFLNTMDEISNKKKEEDKKKEEEDKKKEDENTEDEDTEVEDNDDETNKVITHEFLNNDDETNKVITHEFLNNDDKITNDDETNIIDEYIITNDSDIDNNIITNNSDIDNNIDKKIDTSYLNNNNMFQVWHNLFNKKNNDIINN